MQFGVREDPGRYANLDYDNDNDATIELVLCRWGALELGLPAGRVAALEADLDPAAPTIGALLGLPAAPGGMRVLRLAGPGAVVRIRVQAPVTQVRLPAAAIHALPPLLAARLRRPWVRALAWRPQPAPGALVVILDPGDSV